MRIDIKTKTPVRDKEIRALYVLSEGLKMSSDKMRKANLEFVLGKYGFTIVSKSLNQSK